ncbi:MAG: Unknown protein [uncultured Aureispira sp.]|uniref:Uncharacterized protein n=1 Tax=uncultured Aureispira sp. TaxID=1331704 RepID=A0A6S6THI1_9BACT|nr:MAG: Unknown protein [uncultured Aureispira sp.]
MAHNLKSFIEDVLISEIKIIQQTHGHHYLSFSLISQGIEFLGACLDDKELNAPSQSSKRFERAIKDLFPNKYRAFNNQGTPFNLYKNLRCGLLHICIPKNKIELTQRAEGKNEYKHLTKSKVREEGEERLILVSEDLFYDFEKACRKVIAKYENNELNGNKIPDTLLETDLK